MKQREKVTFEKTPGQERDVYFLFLSHSELDESVPGIPVGPVSLRLHYFQNFLTPCLLPSDPEMLLALG